ncbi:MAG: hypothetical protein AB8D52_03605 [Gammaproteobacteria bacterium]
METKFTNSMKSVLCSLLVCPVMLIPTAVSAEDAFWEALTNGKTDFSLRVRYENVDDDLQPNEANATTARFALGYKTGLFHGFGAYGQVEHIQDIFGGTYNNPADPEPGYATIVDPVGTEINQSYIFYTGLADTTFKAGRQNITYRKAPFHRYVGTILWRQNWQTQDAFTIVNNSLPDTTLSYAYSWKVNRIFGEDAPSPLDSFDSDSHLINVQYDGFSNTKIEAYAYLLDFDNAAAFSTDTYGLRANGGIPINEKVKAIYTAEYATQSDSADNPNSIDADYYLAEVGANFKLGGSFKDLTLKLSHEVMEGNGGADRFVTILGTNHAFQGWADRFLVTPGTGIKDTYVTAVLKAFGAKFVVSYHDLDSDEGSYDYGNELDLLALKTIGKHYTVGLKYADYDADNNSNNSGAQAADTTKFWAFVQMKF